MTDPVKKYKEEFGEDAEVPHAYLGGQDLIDAVDDAIERGEPYTDKEWLEVAGFTEEEIQQIENGDIVI